MWLTYGVAWVGDITYPQDPVPGSQAPPTELPRIGPTKETQMLRRSRNCSGVVCSNR